MLQPKRTKFRKAHKGRIHGLAKGGTKLNFGSYGLKAIQPERVTARQIESARRAIRDIFVVQVEFGLEYFLMFQFRANQLRLEWEKGKVHLNTGFVE